MGGRAEVEKLLDSYDEADTSFLEEPAEKEVVSQLPENETRAMNVTTGVVSTANSGAGTVLAERHLIIGLLGRGGIGEVYKAEDIKLDQIFEGTNIEDLTGHETGDTRRNNVC